MLLRILLAAFSLTVSAQTVRHPSTDGAFSLELSGGRLGRTQGDTVFAWGAGRTVRVSVSRFTESLDGSEIFSRTAEDAARLRQKGRRVDAPQLLKGAVPFSLTGFGTTSFGYFNAGGGTYSFLIKGLQRPKAAEILATLRQAPAQTAPQPEAGPAMEPAPAPPAELPPADGSVGFLEGRLEFPNIEGWRFTPQSDGWTLVEGPDWSFALSSRIIEEIPAEHKETIQGTAAAFFARFEIDFVQSRGCQASPIEGGELANAWKMLLKTYRCPGMADGRRQIVGILLPPDLPMIGWTGDFDRPQSLALFEKWLGAGHVAAPKGPQSSDKPKKKTPALLLAAIGGGLGFSVMILLMIWRRRKREAAPASE